jgi:hypothetical protein
MEWARLPGRYVLSRKTQISPRYRTTTVHKQRREYPRRDRKYPATMIPEDCMSHPQFELQAIVARGWLLTKAAEPATSKLSTTAKARIFNDRPR